MLEKLQAISPSADVSDQLRQEVKHHSHLQRNRGLNQIVWEQVNSVGAVLESTEPITEMSTEKTRLNEELAREKTYKGELQDRLNECQNALEDHQETSAQKIRGLVLNLQAIQIESKEACTTAADELRRVRVEMLKEQSGKLHFEKRSQFKFRFTVAFEL